MLQQLITFKDACIGWAKLVQKYGTPVPGMRGLYIPPEPAILARLGTADYVACGILPQRASLIKRLAPIAPALERLWNGGAVSPEVFRTQTPDATRTRSLDRGLSLWGRLGGCGRLGSWRLQSPAPGGIFLQRQREKRRRRNGPPARPISTSPVSGAVVSNPWRPYAPPPRPPAAIATEVDALNNYCTRKPSHVVVGWVSRNKL